MTTQKWVYQFAKPKTEGNAQMRDLLGGKGANLAEMARMGLPIPPGFTITTAACMDYYQNNKKIPKPVLEQARRAIEQLGQQSNGDFADSANPLIVSVRSGARESMPGMMDTILNLGLNDKSVVSLAKKTNDARFAFDSYRRLIQMYASVVLKVSIDSFEAALANYREQKNYLEDAQMTAKDWQNIIGQYHEIIEQETSKSFPQDPYKQLWGALKAVFDSWQNERAITYRRLYKIPHNAGTAVNVQVMVFGNMGENSMTGVCFTRDPNNGKKYCYGEYLLNAQGEDVVAGLRTPLSIAKNNNQKNSMQENKPHIYQKLQELMLELENHYKDMQDIEFTVQEGELYILQTRAGKRTARAAMNIAKDMYDEKLISIKEAVLRISPASLRQLLHARLKPDIDKEVLAISLPASPGAAAGEIVFSADEAVRKAADDKRVILVRSETSPEDIHGMDAAQGILTGRGGMTSHAAVVARGMGKPCIVGCSDMRIDIKNKTVSFGDISLSAGEYITIDGSSGEVIKGNLPTLSPELDENFEWLIAQADKIRSIKIRANAETKADAKIAIRFGVDGIGLCRTEHMFFADERIMAMRRMIVAENQKERNEALAILLPMQKQDFIELFQVMQGLPVTVRLLDPPLHEFLPHEQAGIDKLALLSGKSVEKVKLQLAKLKEFNPMLGHRGCRLAITYPEIYAMQTRAIFLAAIEVTRQTGKTVIPEIMIPLVSIEKELSYLRKIVDDVAEQVFSEQNLRLDYEVGTMIELPRAALCADQLAKVADFLSFGTNDLTQTTFGISRDDAGSFLDFYQKNNFLDYDPFVRLDNDGVGELIKIACRKGQTTKANIKLGICGEHGGDPDSIDFCVDAGLHYVSCSPFRIPSTKIAAAQAEIRKSQLKNPKNPDASK